MVEVGRTQSWKSLVDAATWWSHFDGVEYIFLLKVSARARRLQYALYDIQTPGRLPSPPSQEGIIHYRRVGNPPELITIDMRRILAIPLPHPLLAGVNPQTVVDLSRVMQSLSRQS